MTKSKKKKRSDKKEVQLHTLDRYVISVFVYWIIFVITSWITFWIVGSVPDTLIQYGLGGGAIELAMAAAIKIFKLRNGVKDKSEDEDIMEG